MRNDGELLSSHQAMYQRNFDAMLKIIPVTEKDEEYVPTKQHEKYMVIENRLNIKGRILREKIGMLAYDPCPRVLRKPKTIKKSNKKKRNSLICEDCYRHNCIVRTTTMSWFN